MSELPSDPWLVLRTRSRHENLVESSLRQREIVAYLPRWKGARSDVPLFPGYVFVRPRPEQYEALRYIRGSCGFVLGGGSRPAAMPERELRAVMKLVDSGSPLSIDPALGAGRRVKIVAGPLAGVEGSLVRVKSRTLLVVNVELVNSSLRVEVEHGAIEVLEPA